MPAELSGPSLSNHESSVERRQTAQCLLDPSGASLVKEHFVSAGSWLLRTELSGHDLRSTPFDNTSKSYSIRRFSRFEQVGTRNIIHPALTCSLAPILCELVCLITCSSHAALTWVVV
ncbi:uncharacterized protein UV8b_07517 [Ustilaginoidea virens]|uniref:Uncharacterized protein n=1 Tax=Ustilaginoidea virens TaxID=1159556 RepID=A0A8E5HXD9_USTVR|nr:uncharacterized protein UV8b_07517 [Ustilaginoidea virens]QUC23276.1 hypothetical protein UV8b_07517 [Ustilaginoidea virens]